MDLTIVLLKIGFKPTDGMFLFDFGNCQLRAIPGMNNYLADGFTFLGSYKTERTAGMIDFFLPLEVKSYEQGIALIAYYLRKADFAVKPHWLIEGLAMKGELPW